MARARRGVYPAAVRFDCIASSLTFPELHHRAGCTYLSGCVLARIFRSDITMWDHPAIVQQNPDLRIEEPGYPIFVARRLLGSRSTHAITNYLHQHCPSEWPLEHVASKIDWHPSTYPCDGKDLMTACILGNEGSIGYVDSVYGHEEGLMELGIINADGRYLTSLEAGYEGIQASAIDLSNVPDSSDGDFSQVEFYNKVRE